MCVACQEMVSEGERGKVRTNACKVRVGSGVSRPH